MNKINLNNCIEGDKLKLRSGMIATYVERHDNWNYPHEIKTEDGREGSRTDDGHVWINIRSWQDEDVIEILPRKLDRAKFVKALARLEKEIKELKELVDRCE